jgi:hypothetical protein
VWVEKTGFLIFLLFGVLSQRFIDPLWHILQLCAFNSLTRGQTLGPGDYWECLERYIRDRKQNALSLGPLWLFSILAVVDDEWYKAKRRRKTCIDICLVYRHHPHTYVLIYICSMPGIRYTYALLGRHQLYRLLCILTCVMWEEEEEDWFSISCGESLSQRKIAPSHKSRRRVLHVLCVCVGNDYESPALWRIIFPHHFRYEHLTSSLPPPFTHNNQPYRKNTFLPFWKTTFLTAG